MTDRPILFSAPMVRALIEGRKTQTRRVLKPQPGDDIDNAGDCETIIDMATGKEIRMPFAYGDRLWVKETWRAGASWDDKKPTLIHPGAPVDYLASPRPGGPAGKTRVAIFMPRWASRLTLTVTEVRVERLQDCSEGDALVEGIDEDLWDQAPVARDYRQPDAWFVGWSMGVGSPNTSVDAERVCRESYRTLWNSINGAGAWESNPWVVAVTFTVEQRNIDA